MTAKYSFLDEKLASFYGTKSPEKAFGRVDNIPNRQGILTMASVLSISGLEAYTQPIYRGFFSEKAFFVLQ